MRSTTSIYYIEVKEKDGSTKRVPHTKNTKFTNFFIRQQAVEFLNDLVQGNPGISFRLCKETTTETSEKWQTQK